MQIYALLAKRTLWSSQAILPVLAFAASSAIFLTVAGGVHAMGTWLVTDKESGNAYSFDALLSIQTIYTVLAWIAAIILLIPMFTLGASAARLSARRRDERLASLRLMGASTTLIVGLSVADAVVYAAMGYVLGLLLYLLLCLPFGALKFANVPLGAQNMLLPLDVILWCFLGCLLLAALSSLFGLAKVTISPLGVRTRTKAGSAGWISLGIGIILVIIAMTVSSFSKGVGSIFSANGDYVGQAIFYLIMFIGVPALLTMLAIDLFGTFIVWTYATVRVRMTQKPSVLLGYRAVLESPRAAWRQVSGVALSTFMVTFFGPILIMLNEQYGASSQRHTVNSDNSFDVFFGDIFQGLILMLFFSYLLVTLSAVLNQSSSIYERSSLYSSLNMMGAPIGVLQSSRRTVVFGPLVIISVISSLLAFPVSLMVTAAGASGELLLRMFGLTFGAVTLGLVLVFCGLMVTGPLMRQVAHKPVSAL